MEISEHNRRAWDGYVDEGNEFTVPVDSEIIAYAKKGEFAIYPSPYRPAPQDWFPSVQGLEVLCLGGGGGQQGPVLAAAGARVTVFDLSPKQLEQDRRAAEREGLQIETVEGDMADLSALAEGRFDLIVNPVSNLYVPNLRPVWGECARVLKPGGVLAAGFMNPALYIFDRQVMDQEGELRVRHALPYSDLHSLSREELENVRRQGWPLEFSHSLEAQIGGQIEAGFSIIGMYEDRDPRSALYEYMPVYIATRAVKQKE
jgi:2-polyprenyl-3-methyl-5-hydroxy-6-metoxy-1,4-benzoquinol methylase